MAIQFEDEEWLIEQVVTTARTYAGYLNSTEYRVRIEKDTERFYVLKYIDDEHIGTTRISIAHRGEQGALRQARMYVDEFLATCSNWRYRRSPK
tara:strand:+ start:489 stop:770 length:282 start_codon:yes stop_codon:yes gene_type:complete